jgi:hypothetical protein
VQHSPGTVERLVLDKLTISTKGRKVKENWERSFNDMGGDGAVEEWPALKPDRVDSRQTKKTVSIV